MKSIVWIGEGGVSDDVRIRPYAARLSYGRKCHYIRLPYNISNLSEYVIQADCAVFCRPTIPQLIYAYKALNAKIVIDWDDDYWAIPQEHPGYKSVGMGNPDVLDRVSACIEHADLLTFSTQELANRFERFNKPYQVIPNGWCQDNPLWNIRRSLWNRYVTFGWTGTITHIEDFEIAKEPLLRLLKRDRNTAIIIGSDVRIYKMFKEIEERRKAYYPMIDYASYPYALSHYNVFVVPLRDTYFNAAKSDIKLVEAGAARLPFVASNISVYSSWPGGGILARTQEEWSNALALLARDVDLRNRLGEEGHKIALTREANIIAQEWVRILDSL